jgi:sugar phosphate isomerase/epimerase
MKDSIHKYFKVGLVSFMSYPSAFAGNDPHVAENIKRVACDDYFDAIEVCRIKDADDRSKVKRLLESSHVTVSYAAPPRLLTEGLNANHTDEDERAKAESALMEALDDAKDLGASDMYFGSGKWREETRGQNYAQLLKTTRNVCERAKAMKMTVKMEILDFDVAKSSLIGAAPYAARFAADVRTTHSNFGFLLDLAHIPLTHETPEFAVRALRPYLMHFHVGNTVCSDPSSVGYGDEHQRFGFPNSFNDTAQVLDFLRVLKNEQFFNKENPYILSLEVKPWKDEDPDVVLTNAKRTLNRAWAMLED